MKTRSVCSVLKPIDIYVREKYFKTRRMDRPEGSPKRPTHPPQFFTCGDTVVLTKRPKKTFFGKETFFFRNIIQKRSPRGCFLPIPLKYIHILLILFYLTTFILFCPRGSPWPPPQKI